MDAGQDVGRRPRDAGPKRFSNISLAHRDGARPPSIEEVFTEIENAGVTSLIGAPQAIDKLISLIRAASSAFGYLVRLAEDGEIDDVRADLECRPQVDLRTMLIVSGGAHPSYWPAQRAGRSNVALVVLGPCADVQAVFVCSASKDSPAIYRRTSVETSLVVSTASSSFSAVERLDRPPVEINLLGPIEIRGIEAPLRRRPKLTELVVFLAMHPRGATSRAWTTALWPDRRVPVQTVANRLSEARRALGFAPDGRPRLRRDGEHHLIADAMTDWQHFSLLADPSESPRSWKQALELVRGRPFDDLQQGQWTALEGFASEIEQSIVNCALRLGHDALENGQPGEASWAAQMALRAAPWDERLHRLLMHSADACGNRAGVEAILRHLALVLEIDGDPLQGVHPKTAALYELLSGRVLAP